MKVTPDSLSHRTVNCLLLHTKQNTVVTLQPMTSRNLSLTGTPRTDLQLFLCWTRLDFVFDLPGYPLRERGGVKSRLLGV